MLSAGVDTWSICWYLPYNSSGRKAIESLATQRTRRGLLVEESIAGHRVGYFPGSRLLYAEGHPAEDRLAKLGELPGAARRVFDSLHDRGVVPPTWSFSSMRSMEGDVLKHVGESGFAGIRRLDTTVDLQGSSAVGQAILAGVASVEPPRLLRSNVHRAKRGRGIETITWEGESGKVARIYDKGLESRSHGLPGERIRFEDQRRFPKGSRPTVDAVVDGYAEHLFHTRFGPLREATKGIVVKPQAQLVVDLSDLVDEGVLTPCEADKMLGQLIFEAGGVELGSRTTRWRRRQRLAKAGLLLSDGLVDDVSVDLGCELDDVFEIPFER